MIMVKVVAITPSKAKLVDRFTVQTPEELADMLQNLTNADNVIVSLEWQYV